MMKETELKPCPFCGQRARLWQITRALSGECSGTIRCSCGCTFTKEWYEILPKDGFVLGNDDIVTAWNRRADNEQREAD
jgi:hypothetical protein